MSGGAAPGIIPAEAAAAAADGCGHCCRSGGAGGGTGPPPGGRGGATSGAGGGGPPPMMACAPSLARAVISPIESGAVGRATALPHPIFIGIPTPDGSVSLSSSFARAASFRSTKATKPQWLRSRRSSSDRGHITLTDWIGPKRSKTRKRPSSFSEGARFPTYRLVVSASAVASYPECRAISFSSRLEIPR